MPDADLDVAFDTVRTSYDGTGPDPWEHSRYRWLRQLQSRTRGAAGEQVAHAWLTAAGLRVQPARRGGGDRVVNGHRVEVKLSTQWSGGGFRFSQLRNQDYGHLLLFGVQPDRLQVWCAPKDLVLAHATGQHTGAGAVETRWLSFDVDTVPAWLAPYGGDQATGLGVARAVFTTPPGGCCPAR